MAASLVEMSAVAKEPSSAGSMAASLVAWSADSMAASSVEMSAVAKEPSSAGSLAASMVAW
jgi:hypothetical protein